MSSDPNAEAGVEPAADEGSKAGIYGGNGSPSETNQSKSGSQSSLNGPNSGTKPEPQLNKCVQKCSGCNPFCCCSFIIPCAVFGIISAVIFLIGIKDGAAYMVGLAASVILVLVALYVKFKKDIPKQHNLILAILCFVSAGLFLLSIILIFALVLPPVLFVKKAASAVKGTDSLGLGDAAGSLLEVGATMIIIEAVVDSLFALYGMFVSTCLGCKILAGNAVKKTNFADLPTLRDVEAEAQNN